MGIVAIQAGLAAAVANVTGIRQSFPRLPDDINPATFIAGEYDLSRHLTFSSGGGLRAIPFTCLLLTSRGDTDQGRQDLATFLDEGSATTSVFAALEADKTLGGVCSTLIVDGATGVGRQYEVGLVAYLGAEIQVRVWAT